MRAVARWACWLAACAVFTVAALAAASRPAEAQIGSERYSSIVVDAGTGNVLSAVNPDEPRHPASLTKMMTLYMLFEGLRDRRVALDEMVPVSGHAASMQPSKLGLLPGMRVTVEQLVLGLVTKSANDAASALSELLGGSEDGFAQMMTLRARALGMSHTVFRNASGLPDPDQISTARDLATLGRHLVQDFPVEYRYFSTPNFMFHGRTIYNHDLMLQRYPGADGIKTGYIEASGHNLVTSALRSGVRLVGVVLGAASNPERDVHMGALLDAAFERMDVAPISPRSMQAFRLGNPLIASARAAEATPTVRTAAARGLVPEPPRSMAAHPAVAPEWGVQVGAFATQAAARQAATAARHWVPAGDLHVEQVGGRGKPTWRAQLVGMTEGEMRAAVRSLAQHHIAVGVLRPETDRLASR